MDMVMGMIHKQPHMRHLHELGVQPIFHSARRITTPKPTSKPKSTRNDSSLQCNVQTHLHSSSYSYAQLNYGL